MVSHKSNWGKKKSLIKQISHGKKQKKTLKKTLNVLSVFIIYLNVVFSLKVPSVLPKYAQAALQESFSVLWKRFIMTQLSFRRGSDRYPFTVWLVALQCKSGKRIVCMHLTCMCSQSTDDSLKIPHLIYDHTVVNEREKWETE